MLIASIVFTFQSCRCDDVNCLNGGICNNGECDCPIGFIGESCEVIDFTKIQDLLNNGTSPLELIRNDVPIDSLYGKIYEGGLIFYLNSDDNSGLITTIDDIETGTTIFWGCEGNNIVGISDVVDNPPLSGTEVLPGTRIGDGKLNTLAIVNECTEVGTAARICSDLVIDGNSNWFLPSRGELALMYKNLYLKGLGGFSDLTSSYWSSSELNEDAAWTIIFSDAITGGEAGFAGKNFFVAGKVRAVREF
ncbi:MAG: hypothetical protein AAFY76_04210 [Cyanobacteria bacterium J06649_11]